MSVPNLLPCSCSGKKSPNWPHTSLWSFSLIVASCQSIVLVPISITLWCSLLVCFVVLCFVLFCCVVFVRSVALCVCRYGTNDEIRSRRTVCVCRCVAVPSLSCLVLGFLVLWAGCSFGETRAFFGLSASSTCVFSVSIAVTHSYCRERLNCFHPSSYTIECCLIYG